MSSTSTSLSARVPTHVYSAMLVGLIAGSLSPILTRLAIGEGTPSLVMAVMRLGISALVMMPFILRTYWADMRGLSRRDWLLMAVSGFWLAVYFVSWFKSLEYISVLIGMVLVTSVPIWIAIIETLFLKARLTRLIILGIMVAFSGNIIIALSGQAQSRSVSGEQLLLGVGLALFAAISNAIYRVIGRKQRAYVPLVVYQGVVYSSATLGLLVACLFTSTSLTGYSSEAYVWMLLLALLPQLIGYSSSTYALRFLSATYVTLIIQLETIGSAIMAYLLFSELPTGWQIVGSVVLMCGVALASLGREKK